LQKIKAQVLEI